MSDVSDRVAELEKQQAAAEDARVRRIVAGLTCGSDYDSALGIRFGRYLTAEQIAKERERVLTYKF